MANPIDKIKLFFQALGGSLDEQYKDGEIEDVKIQKEVEQLNKLSSAGVSTLEEKHGRQSITIEKEHEEETDRLGYKKTKSNNDRKLENRPNIQTATKGNSLYDREK